MKRLRNIALVAALFLILVIGHGALALAASAPPTILSYQGRLANSAGDLLGSISGTTYYFKFSVWNNSNVGSGTQVWPASAPASVSSPVRQGVFNVNIGDTAKGYPVPLTLDFSNYSALYLQVEVSPDNVTFETLSPRQQITAAAYAQLAGAIVGTTTQSAIGTTTPYGASQLTLAATSSNATPLSIFGSALQSGNLLQIFSDSFSHLFSIDSTGGVHASSSLAVGGAVQLSSLGNCTLKTDSDGNITCGIDIGGVGQELNWAFFNGSGVRLGTTTNQVLIGGSSTSTLSKLEVHGGAYLDSATIAGDFLTLGSTTLQNFTANNSTTTNATTTNFGIASIVSGKLLKTTTGGAVVAATAGTDFENPLTFNGPLSRSTNAISITQSGLASDGYLSSGDFTAFSNKISSTSLQTSALLASLLSDETGSGSVVFGTNPTITGATLASTTLTGNFVFGNATGTSATTTNSFATNASSTNLFTSNLSIGALTGLLKATAGVISAATGGADYQVPLSFTYPLQNTSNTISLAFGTTTANAWSQLQTFGGGFLSTASTTIGNGTQAGGLTINGGATTTGNALVSGTFNVSGLTTLANLLLTGSTTLQNFTANNSTTTNATSTSLYTNLLGINSNYFSSLLGTGLINSGGALTVSNVPNASLQNSTIGLSDSNSTLTIGGSPAALGGSLTATLNLAHSNNFSALQQFSGNASTTGLSALAAFFGSTATTSINGTGDLFVAGSTTLQNFTAVRATTTQATTTNLAISSITSSLLKTLSNGAVVAAISGVDYSNFTYPFPSNATSTLLTFGGGFLSTASTTIGNGTQAGGLTINGGATTTGNALVSGGLSVNGLTILANASSTALSANTAFFGGSATSTFAVNGALTTPGITISGITGSTQCLHVNSSGTISGTGSDCGTGTGITNPGGSDTQVQFNDGGVFGADAGLTFNKTTGLLSAAHLLISASTTLQNFTFGNATGTSATSTNLFASLFNSNTLAVGGTSTTTINGGGDLFVAGSTTLQNFTGVNATTTTFGIASIVSGNLLKTTTGGAVVAATAGTDFENPLTFNGPLSRSTNAISITQSGLASDGYLSSGDFTAFDNKISSTSLSASSVLTYNSSTGNFTTVGGTFGSGNYVFPADVTINGNATSTNLYANGTFAGAGLSSCSTLADKLLWNASTRQFSCGTDSGASGSDVNWTHFNGSGIRVTTASDQVLIGFTSTSTLSKLEVVGGATIDNATTTNFYSGLITAGNKLGIGTSSPMSALTVAGGNITQVASGTPTLAATLAEDSGNHAYASYVSGNYAYVADYEGGLKIINIGNPKQPNTVGSNNTYTMNPRARAVVVAGKYAYVADENTGLVIFDVSNPRAPSMISTYAIGGTTQSLALSGKYIYINDKNNNATRIIDVSNPTAPVLAGSYTSTSPIGLAVQGKYLYIADFTPAVYIVDISNPVTPALVGTYNGANASAPTSIYVSGSYAYVADQDTGFYSLDISNPSLPVAVGKYPVGAAHYSGIQVAGNYAYVTENDGGAFTKIIDISASTSPQLVGSISHAGTANNLFVAGKYAYVADDSSGLDVVDINGIESPAANIGSLAANTVNISDVLNVGGDIYAGGGIAAGISGISSRGTISAFIASTTQANPVVATFMGGNVGIGTTSPFAALSVMGNAFLTGNFTAANITATGTLSVIGGTTLADATSTSFAVTGSSTISGVFNSVLANNLGSTTLLGSSLFAQATTTNFGISSISSGNLLKTGAGGAVIAAVAGVDYATLANVASAFPFTPVNFGVTPANATSTLIGFTNGLYALASSTIGDGSATGGLTISGNGTTTGDAYFAGTLAVTGSSTVSGTFNSVLANNLGSTTLSGSSLFENATSTSFAVTGSSTINGAFNAGGTAYFGGNVGIGTTSPYANLTVWGADTSAGTLSFLVANSASTTNFSIDNAGNGYVAGRFGIGTSTPFANLSINADVGQTPFAVGSSTGSLFIISSSGNVGVGTSTPFSKFAVTNTASAAQSTIAYDATDYANQYVNATGDLFMQASGGDNIYNNDNVWLCTGGSDITVNNCPSGAPSGRGNLIVENKINIGTSTNSAKLGIETQDGTTNFLQIGSTTNQNLFNINANGNVGIGTSTPFAKLAIGPGGAIITTENAVADAGTITISWAQGNQQSVTLGGNRTINFTNYISGEILRLIVCQDATGNRTVTWDSKVMWSGGSAPNLTSTAGYCDLMAMVATNATGTTPIIFGSSVLNFP